MYLTVFKFSTFILFFGGVSPRPPPQNFEKISFIWCGNKYKKCPVNLGNLRWAVTKLLRAYCTKNLLSIKKGKKEEKDGKIIECIAIGLRYLSVRRPKKYNDNIY